MKSSEISIGLNTYNLQTGRLTNHSGEEPELRHQSREVLKLLAESPGETIAKAVFFEKVWERAHVSEDSLVQCITEIRQALGDADRNLLETVPRKGYRLNATPIEPGRRWGMVAAAAVLLLIATFAWVFRPEPAPASNPRIAVLAFEDLSAGADKGYLSDGFAEGILTELASYRELEVIARNSSFSFRDTGTDVLEIAEKLRADFILEGSKQRSGERLRVTVQLINGKDGTHIWAHEYTAELGDLFDVQSRIVRSVATHLGRELAWHDPQVGGRDRVSALHYYLQGNSEYFKQTHDAVVAARDLYLKAIEADPDAPYGHVGMALIFWHDSYHRWIYPGMSPEEMLRRGIEHAEKALEIDPKYYAAHIARGDMHFIAGEHEEAIIRYGNAAELNPSSGEALALPSDSLIYLNRADEAVELMRQAIDINPIPPGWYYENLAQALWATGNCAEGIRWMKKRSRLRPQSLRTLMVLQACNGDLEDARQTVATHLEADPDYTVRTYEERARDLWNNPELLQRWLDDMRKAGMPEG